MDAIERPLRILIIDDDLADRMLVRRLLRETNLVCAEVNEREDAASAIALLTDTSHDCIFLDYRLPDLDGLQLIPKLRGLGIGSPIIVLTGQGDQEIAVQLMKAGAADYVVKSRLTVDLIAQAVRSALRIYEAEEAIRHAQQELQLTNALLLQQNQALEEHRRAIQRQNIEVVRASRLKSEFLATMSHELRTPLNAIIGFSQLLLRRRQPVWTEQQSEMVQRIHSNANNLLTLLNEILDFSKLDARRLELHLEPMNLESLAQDTIAEMQSLTAQKPLELTLEADLAHPIITNDPARLRQVLTNLISNAVKFTHQGEVKLSVSEVDDQQVMITVADTGQGMEPDELDYIFEAFRQIDQSYTRKHAGAGLGLAIVDAIVTLMNGTIEVKSTPGQGTTFFVQVPRVVEVAK